MSKIKKLIIIVIVFVVLITTSFVGALYWMQSKANAEAEIERKKNEINIVSYEMTEAIVVNIMNSNKYLRVKPIIKFKNNTEEDLKILAMFGLAEGSSGTTSGDGILKPTFNMILRSKSLEEIQKPDSLITFGKEIAEQLNHAFECDTFQNVEFAEFIYQ